MEYSERWTRGEILTVTGSAKNEEYLEVLRRKCTSMNLITLNGVQATNPQDLTEDLLDDLEWDLFLWFMGTPVKAINEVMKLGEAKRRQSLPAAEKTAEQG